MREYKHWCSELHPSSTLHTVSGRKRLGKEYQNWEAQNNSTYGSQSLTHWDVKLRTTAGSGKKNQNQNKIKQSKTYDTARHHTSLPMQLAA